MRAQRWEIPSQAHPISDIIARTTGLEFAGNGPDVLTLFRRHAPGLVLANLLALIERNGGTNAGGMTAWAGSGEHVAWSHDAMRTQLIDVGVDDHAAASRLAWLVCPDVIDAIRESRDRRDKARRGDPLRDVGAWVAKCLESGRPYEAAIRAAKLRHAGRARADAERNRRELDANAARVAVKGAKSLAADQAAANRAIVREASAKRIAAALAELRRQSPFHAGLVNKRRGDYRAKNPDATPADVDKVVAMNPSILPGVAQILAAEQEPAAHG